MQFAVVLVSNVEEKSVRAVKAVVGDGKRFGIVEEVVRGNKRKETTVNRMTSP